MDGCGLYPIEWLIRADSLTVIALPCTRALNLFLSACFPTRDSGSRGYSGLAG
jgi:hypothetical protein